MMNPFNVLQKPTSQKSGRRALMGETIIAEAPDTQRVDGYEYFPPDAVRWQFLEPSDHTSVCGWKGVASYYDVVVDGDRLPAAAWTYRTPSAEANPSLEMDHGARQGAGDSLDGLDFGNDKLPESINVCGLHAHNDVVRAGEDVGGGNARDAAELRGYLRLFCDLGLDENVSFDHCFSRKAHRGLNRSPAEDKTAGKKPQPAHGPPDAAGTRQ